MVKAKPQTKPRAKAAKLARKPPQMPDTSQSEERIGKIKVAEFGIGGYQGAMIGFTFDLGGNNWGVTDFWGTWAKRPDTAQWTVDDQIALLGKATLRVKDLLKASGKEYISDLVGVPIMVTFFPGAPRTLRSWRILTEAL